MKYLLLSLILIAIASRYAFAATTCFGFDQNDPRVCSGNGTCSSNDTCICTTGFNGSFCQDYTCGGIHFNETNVCSSRGACIDLNNCLCQAPFSGSVCQDFKCFGIGWKAPGVCNGQGNCTAPNTCKCKPNWTGPECKGFTCGGKPSNATDVCSGRGICTGPNQCQCNSQYSGTDCQDFKCFNIDSKSPAVCNGKGTCGAPNNCTCSQGFSGPSCNLVSCNGQQFNADSTSASFSGNAREIIVSFTLPIVQAARTACANGLRNVIATTSWAKLADSTCSFLTTSTMKISLSVNATVNVGDLISYKANTIKAEGCAVVFNGHPVQFPQNPVPIKAELKGPTTIAPCAGSKIILDAGLSSGAGKIIYRWKLMGISSALNTRLMGLPNFQQKVLVDFSEFTAATTTPFVLTIIDQFNRNSTVVYNVVKASSADALSASITGQFLGNNLPRHIAGGLGVTTTRSNCTNPAFKATFQWSSTPPLYIMSNTTSSVIIPPFQTTDGVEYTVHCDATLKNGGTIGTKTRVSYKFFGTKGPLELVLAGQKQQTLKNNGMLVLDASKSKDLNNKNGAITGNVTYGYSCCQELGGQCIFAGCAAKWAGLGSFKGNKYTLSGVGNNTLPLGTFQFVASISQGQRFSSDGLRVKVVPAGSPIVNTAFVQQGCLRGQIAVTTQNFGGNMVSFSYKVTSGSVKVLSNVTNTVAKSALFLVDISKTVTTTNIDFTATWQNQTATGTVTIIPSARPSGGSVQIQDLNGNAVVGNLKGDTRYNLVVSGWSTSNNDAITNSATLFFTAGKVKTVLRFSRSSTTRPFKTPLNINANLVGKVDVVLETAQACSKTLSSINFGVNKFTLPNGVSLVDLAKAQEADLKNAIATGSPSDVQNAVSGILNVLQQSTGGNATERAILKAQALDSFRNSILSDTAPVTAESRSAGLDILRSSATVVSEITASARGAAVAVLKKLFAAPTANDEGIDTATADSAFLTVGSLFDSIVFVPPAGNKTSVLLSLDDLLQTSITDFQNLQGVAKNVALQAVVLKGLGEVYHSVSSSFNISVYKNPGTAYPSTFSPFMADGSMSITKSPVITGGPAVLDTLFARYPKAFYKSVGNYARMTSDAYTIEIIDDSTKLPATVVTAGTPIEFRLKAASTAGQTNACNFYNTQSGNFEAVELLSYVTGVSVDCRSTHLTDFAAFNVDAPVPPPTTQPPTTKPPGKSSAMSSSSGKLFLIAAVVLFVVNMF